MNQDTKLARWMSPLCWSLTSNGNRRRVVNTPGYVFMYHINGKSVRALYKGPDDHRWLTLAETNSVREAQIALLGCAEILGVQWD